MEIKKDLAWKTIESKQIIKDKWVDVKVETHQKADGTIITPFYLYNFPDYAVALALTKDDKVILERMFRPGIKQITIELPGGTVDDTDADIEQTVRRELLEETGYRFDTVEYLGKTSPNPTTNNNFMHMFLAQGGEFDANQELDAEEGVEVFLVSMDEFIDMLQQQSFIQSMQVTCIYLALQKLGKLFFK